MVEMLNRTIRILSFDFGMVNLGLADIELMNGMLVKVNQLQLLSIGVSSGNIISISRSIRELAHSIIDESQKRGSKCIDYVLFEQLPGGVKRGPGGFRTNPFSTKNSTAFALFVSHIDNGFQSISPTTTIDVVSPILKNRYDPFGTHPPISNDKHASKQRSVSIVTEMLRRLPSDFDLILFNQLPKKDDVADAILQACSIQYSRYRYRKN